MDSDSSGDSEYMSSDEELQAEFSKGRLQPGLIVRKRPKTECTNDVPGLEEQLAKLKRKELRWLERLDITSTVVTISNEDEAPTGQDGDGVDAEDDFKREMHFFQQAQSSVIAGLQKLEKVGVPYLRPDDYFAEMIKTDDHMKKVRQSLLSRQKFLEQKEKARKMRELKKYGKKIQQEILQKRRSEKKAMAESIGKFKKGKGDRPSFIDEDGENFPVSTGKTDGQETKDRGQGAGKKRGPPEKSKKRKLKDDRFGFGGKKKRSKSNTAKSSADMSSFSSAKHSRSSSKSHRGGGGKRGEKMGGGKKKGKPIRLGKSRRNKKK